MTICRCKCDKCGKDIPVVTKKDRLGNDVKVFEYGHVKCAEWRIDELFEGIDLCKECADLISLNADNAFLRMKIASGYTDNKK